MNSFPALYGSLEQIHLGPPKSSVEGSSEVPPASKVPPRFQQCLCFSSTDPSWAANSFRLKRLYGVYGIRRDCRADPFWFAKRFCRRFPITSLNLSPSSTTLFIPGWCTQEGLGPKKKERRPRSAKK